MTLRMRNMHQVKVRILSVTPQLYKMPSDNRLNPCIINMVCATVFLPQDHKEKYNLPLERISSVFKGASQFCPDDFPGNILGLSDSEHDPTALIFRSGKMVVVGGVSKNHILYLSQLYRYLIERVRFKHKSGFITFEGRTKFEKGVLNNIVGHGDLDTQVDLARLVLARPHQCKYNPDLFPGLKYRLYLTPTKKCQCGKSKGCTCRVRVLIYGSGRVVITASREVENNYKAFHLLGDIKDQFGSSQKEVIPREERFARRLKEMNTLVEKSQEARNKQHGFLQLQNKGQKRKAEEPTLREEVLSMMQVKHKKHKVESKHWLCIFASQGRIEEAQFVLRVQHYLLETPDENGHTPMDVLTQLDVMTPQHHTILNLFKGVLEKNEHQGKKPTK